VGSITNDDLIYKEEEIWTDSDPSDYRNKVIRGEFRMTKDYKIVNSHIWTFFHSKYGGTEIQRIYRKGYSYGAEIEATLKEIPVCLFPALEDLGGFQNVVCRSIFMSKLDSVKDLKERLVKCI